MTILRVFIVALALAGAAFSQQSSYNGHGYVHYSLAAINTDNSFGAIYTVGAGGDRFVYKGLAAGGSIDYLNAYSDAGSGAGILSPTASYHFANRSDPGKLVPFVNGGYSLAFAIGESVNGFHYGGGATWWFKPKYGLRFEFRDHVFESQHIYALRIGFSFR